MGSETIRISELIEEFTGTIKTYGDLKCVAGYRDLTVGSLRFDKDL